MGVLQQVVLIDAIEHQSISVPYEDKPPPFLEKEKDWLQPRRKRKKFKRGGRR